jgi:hypothetical protein
VFSSVIVSIFAFPSQKNRFLAFSRPLMDEIEFWHRFWNNAFLKKPTRQYVLNLKKIKRPPAEMIQFPLPSALDSFNHRMMNHRMMNHRMMNHSIHRMQIHIDCNFYTINLPTYFGRNRHRIPRSLWNFAGILVCTLSIFSCKFILKLHWCSLFFIFFINHHLSCRYLVPGAKGCSETL